MCFRGGGNRRGTRDIVREIELAAKQLGIKAAKLVPTSKNLAASLPGFLAALLQRTSCVAPGT